MTSLRLNSLVYLIKNYNYSIPHMHDVPAKPPPSTQNSESAQSSLLRKSSLSHPRQCSLSLSLSESSTDHTAHFCLPPTSQGPVFLLGCHGSGHKTYEIRRKIDFYRPLATRPPPRLTGSGEASR